MQSNQSKARRNFLQKSLAATLGLSLASNVKSESINSSAPYIHKKIEGGIRFSTIGLNHGHIYSQTESLIRNGGELVSVFAKEPDLVAAYQKRYPKVMIAKSEQEILEDKSVQMVISASIPIDRAPLGIRVMQHGKDYMADKPGIVTLKQLEEVRKVQKQTGRIYSIMYSERFENRATVKAGELVKAGAIGEVVQTIGLGPHRMSTATRPKWFFDKKYYGGIITDIGSHQCDQFLFFTGSTSAEILSSQVGNVHYPQYPEFEDFGDITLRGNKGAGYIRNDWFTPDGLKTWGDGRLTILGTDGFIEIRKNIDIARTDGGSHLYMANNSKTEYIDCKDVPLTYGRQLIDDVINRTETAMTQKHCFLATELALKAQKKATKLVIEKKA